MKKLFLLAAICIISASAYSQHIKHGIGLGLLVDEVKGLPLNGSFDFIYSPKINLTETAAMSVSLGIPLSVSVCQAEDSEPVLPDFFAFTYSERFIVRVMIHAPLMLNMNFGAGSSEKCDKKFGVFFGGGYGYCYSTRTNLIAYDKEGEQSLRPLGGSTSGVAANGGIRFRARKHHISNIELRLNYYKALTGQNRVNLYGLNTIFYLSGKAYPQRVTF